MPYKDPQKRIEWYEKNKVREASKCKEWRKNNKSWIKKYNSDPVNKERRRATDLKRKYGIDLNEYNRLLESQDYGCSICKCKFDDNLTPHVDHCHNTGRVRGLACRDCNLLLGYAKDDPSILYRAVDYLMGGRHYEKNTR